MTPRAHKYDDVEFESPFHKNMLFHLVASVVSTFEGEGHRRNDKVSVPEIARVLGIKRVFATRTFSSVLRKNIAKVPCARVIDIAYFFAASTDITFKLNQRRGFSRGEVDSALKFYSLKPNYLYVSEGEQEDVDPCDLYVVEKYAKEHGLRMFDASRAVFSVENMPYVISAMREWYEANN